MEERAGMEDQSLKEAVLIGVEHAKSKASMKLAALSDAAANFLGAKIFPHIPTVSVVLAGIAIGLGIPLAMASMSNALIIVVPIALLGALFGLVSSQSKLSVAGMLVSVLAVVETVAAGVYFHHEKQVGRNQLEHRELENAREAGKQREAEIKAAEEAKAKQDAEIAAKEADARAIKKAEEDKRNAEFLRQQQLAAAELAAREKKKHDEEVAAKQRADDEVKRQQAAELTKQAQAIQKSEQLELTKTTYREKSLKADELSQQLDQMETAIKVAKDSMERKATYLERRNSPSPPSEDDLNKAQKQYDDWKKEFTRLQTEIPKVRDELAKVNADKKKASELLDTLQKP
jgi:hypothetical protein